MRVVEVQLSKLAHSHDKCTTFITTDQFDAVVEAVTDAGFTVEQVTIELGLPTQD